MKAHDSEASKEGARHADGTSTRGVSTRARWGLALVAVLVLGLAAYTAVAWRRYEQVRRIQQDVPPMPDLAGKPVAFRERVTTAYAQLRTAGTALSAVGELGRLYHANAYRREADACWRCLLRVQPGEPRWHYYEAALLQFDGRIDEAVAELTRTVELDPRYAPAWLELAEQNFKSGNLAAARGHFERRLALKPGDPYADLGLARIALLREQRDEARQRLEGIVRDHPAFSPARNLYAELLAAAGDEAAADEQRWQGRIAGRFREAEDPWLDELRWWCFDPSQLAVWGNIDFQAKFGDRGKAMFARAIEVAPENPAGYEALGQWYLENNDLTAALKMFTQAVQLPRPSTTLFVNLAETFRRLGQPAETLRAIERGMALIPDTSELFYELGVAYDDLGRASEAMAAYRVAIARSPNAAAAHVNLAVNLLKLGRQPEALENLQLALKAQPSMPKALAMLGDLALAAGDLERAGQYIRPLYKFYPGMPRARHSMAQWNVVAGSAAAGQGKLAEAEHAYLEALKIEPESVDANGKLGVLYGQNGRYQDALIRFETVHRLQPADPRPAMFLGIAYAQLGRMEDARRILAEGEQLATKAGNAEMAARFREMLRSAPP
jgi:HemY protein